jgi:hypothetical protein
MDKSTHYDLSPIAVSLIKESIIPSFSIPTRLDNSAVLRVSFDDQDYGETSSIADSITTSYPPKSPKLIFLPNYNDTYQVPSKPRGLYSADLWPVGFTREEWQYVWNSEPIKIDSFLEQTNQEDPLRPHAAKEDQFKGASWRLTVKSHVKGTTIPMFSHGRVVTYRDCNQLNQRYIIDHCAYQDESTAYLRVICFASRREVFDAQSHYPPFILAIPRRLCDVRLHPDLDIISLSNSSVSAAENLRDEPPSIPSYLSMDQEETTGWFTKIFHVLFKSLCCR